MEDTALRVLLTEMGRDIKELRLGQERGFAELIRRHDEHDIRISRLEHDRAEHGALHAHERGLAEGRQQTETRISNRDKAVLGLFMTLLSVAAAVGTKLLGN